MSFETPPLTGITTIGENDIVCGRGGAALKHPGNLAYRKIVNINKTLYATCLKAEKLRISKSIVAAIREVNGRFLEREDGKISTTLDERNPDGSAVTWCDIGDRRAIEKTSQALREGQPKLLKKLQQEGNGGAVAAAGVRDPNGFGSFNSNNGFNANGGSFNNNVPLQQSMQQTSMQQNSMPPLPQINVPMEDQMNYQYGATQQQQGGGNYSTGSISPSYLKQDSFQQMIGETINVNNNQQQQQQSNDPFSNHTSLSQPPPPNASFQNSHNPHDSWQADPTPLPFHIHSSITMGKDESKQLLHALDLETSKRSSVNSSSVIGGGGSSSNDDSGQATNRPSVTFKNIGGRGSIMSLGSHFSELSNWDTQSLDSAMDIAEREVDLRLLGNEELDFDWGDTYYENNYGGGQQQQQEMQQEEVSRRGSGGPMEMSRRGSGGAMMIDKQRGSILRRTSRYSRPTQNNFPAALSDHTDPGMLFTSTFDAKPGGLNAGTDVSGLLGDRRKSAVAFELKGDQQRRMSNIRLSNVSMFSEMGQLFRRDLGSTMSIQSADIRDLIDMEADDDEDDDGHV